jgi:hypothetical protein
VNIVTHTNAGLDRRRLLLGGLLLGTTALVLVDPNALCLLPALLLAAPLLLRRYPGENRLIAWRRTVSTRRRTVPLLASPRWLAVRVAPRGGLLLARSLAVRPPPALAAAS